MTYVLVCATYAMPGLLSVVWLDRIATNALDGIATNGIREYYFNYVFNGSYAHRDACRTATTSASTLLLSPCRATGDGGGGRAVLAV